MLSRADTFALTYAAAIAGGIALWGLNPYVLWVPTAILLALFIDGIARPGSSFLYPTISHGPRDGRQVALTFDDGPDPQVTPQVLDTLARHGARATFFGIGRSLEAHADLMRRALREGNEIGNHSWRHSRFQNFFGARKQTDEIRRGAAAVFALTIAGSSEPGFTRRGARDAASTTGRAADRETTAPAIPRSALIDAGAVLDRVDMVSRDGMAAASQVLYRAPMGLKSPPFARAAAREGLRVIAWSINSRDALIRDPERVAHRVLKRIRPGDIVLMHDGHDLPGQHRPTCVAALALILEGLQQRQLQCVTVSELLAPAAESTTAEKSSLHWETII